MSVTILVDNHAGENLSQEHGLAFWIQAGGCHILFDTGQGESLPANVAALGIDLSLADHVVLSHGHYDHGGALPYAMAQAPNAIVHLHPAATQLRFSIHEGEVKSIGLNDASLDAVAAAQTAQATQPYLLAPGVGLTGAVPRLTTFEDTGGPFFNDTDGHQPDPITDDLSLWIDTPRGLTVCLGCAHAGVINILTHIQQISGCEKIDTIIGGMHLVAADETRMRETVKALRDLAPRRIVPCHCTGDDAVAYLRSELGDVVKPGRSGQVWPWDG